MFGRSLAVAFSVVMFITCPHVSFAQSSAAEASQISEKVVWWGGWLEEANTDENKVVWWGG